MLLISFIANPCPSPPTWNTFLPIARNRSSLAAKVSARPPTITDRVAASAPCVTPLTGAEARGKTARGKRGDRAHAKDDVTLFGGSYNPVLAEDHGLGLIGGLDHADRAMAFGGNGFGRGFEGRAGP